MQFIYVAKRSIQGGHTSSSQYTINVEVTANDRSSSTTGKRQTSLDKSAYTVVHSDDYYLSITTEIIDPNTTPDIDDMREFLDSVKVGETFSIDSVNYVLESLTAPYRESRALDNGFRYSFKARKL